MCDDPTKIDADLAKAIREASAKPRGGIADFFEGADKSTKELFVVQTALEKAEISVAELKSRGDDDPPDCQGLLDGKLIGIEATELVAQEVIEQFKCDGMPAWKDWSPETFLALLESRIAKKDSPKEVKGGPYSKYFLVVYTDEWLSEDVQASLAGFVPRVSLLDELLLLTGSPNRRLFKLVVQKK